MKKKILIISSSFYKDLEKKLLLGALIEIDKKLFDVNHFSVSGARIVKCMISDSRELVDLSSVRICFDIVHIDASSTLYR